MKLYIANKNYSSWSLRPWVLMRELGRPFEETREPFGEDAAEMHERFSRFSPSAKVPCLHDGELRIWDSLAIVEHLAERHLVNMGSVLSKWLRLKMRVARVL